MFIPLMTERAGEACHLKLDSEVTLRGVLGLGVEGSIGTGDPGLSPCLVLHSVATLSSGHAGQCAHHALRRQDSFDGVRVWCESVIRLVRLGVNVHVVHGLRMPF